jgi:isopenicillin N synthase-like dioxygenase
MLEYWTKGTYRSNVHRVINRSGKDRYSLPFFFDGGADVKLQPLDGSKPWNQSFPTVEEHMLARFAATYDRKVGGENGIKCTSGFS